MTLGESIWELELICLSSPTKPWLFDAWRVWFITCACLHNLMRYGMRLTQKPPCRTPLGSFAQFAQSARHVGHIWFIPFGAHPAWSGFLGFIATLSLHSCAQCPAQPQKSSYFVISNAAREPKQMLERLSRRSGQSLVLEGWVPRAGQYESAICNSQNKNQWTNSS